MNSCFKALFIFEMFSWFILAIILLITNWVNIFMYFTVVDICITETISLRQPTLGIQNLCFKSTIMNMEHPGRNNSIIYWRWPVRIVHQVGHHTGYIQSLLSGKFHQFIKENYLCWRLSTYGAPENWWKELQRIIQTVDLLLVRKRYFVKHTIFLWLFKIVVDSCV